MNDNVPPWLRIVAVVLLVAVVTGVGWAASIFANALPDVVAYPLAAIIMIFGIGCIIYDRSARRRAKRDARSRSGIVD